VRNSGCYGSFGKFSYVRGQPRLAGGGSSEKQEQETDQVKDKARGGGASRFFCFESFGFFSLG
jgi:hypothetical protein